MPSKDSASTGWNRTVSLAVACLLATAVVGLVLLNLTGSTPPEKASRGGPGASSQAVQHKSLVSNFERSVQVPSSSLTATLTKDIPKFSTPDGASDGMVPATWFSAPSVLPVLAQQPGFLEVGLAQRPNGSTAWVRDSDVHLGVTPYWIEVNLSTKRLQLFQDGRLVLDAPAGVGTAADPTPVGRFFVAFNAVSPSPAWGPFVMVTSGHSDAISDWERSGDALVAIHGPLGADAQIGTTGAMITHGCVRLHVSDQELLKGVPPGTPIQIAS